MRSRDSPKPPRLGPSVLDPACTPRTLSFVCFYSCSCFCDLFCTCCSPHPCSLPLPSFPSNCQAGHTLLRVWGVAWQCHVSSVSGDVGDLKRQTIPTGFWPCPCVPWAWSLGQGIRVSAVNTSLLQPFRGFLKKDAATDTSGGFLGRGGGPEEEAVSICDSITNEDPPQRASGATPNPNHGSMSA